MNTSRDIVRPEAIMPEENTFHGNEDSVGMV